MSSMQTDIISDENEEDETSISETSSKPPASVAEAQVEIPYIPSGIRDSASLVVPEEDDTCYSYLTGERPPGSFNADGEAPRPLWVPNEGGDALMMVSGSVPKHDGPDAVASHRHQSLESNMNDGTQGMSPTNNNIESSTYLFSSDKSSVDRKLPFTPDSVHNIESSAWFHSDKSSLDKKLPFESAHSVDTDESSALFHTDKSSVDTELPFKPADSVHNIESSALFSSDKSSVGKKVTFEPTDSVNNMASSALFTSDKASVDKKLPFTPADSVHNIESSGLVTSDKLSVDTELPFKPDSVPKPPSPALNPNTRIAIKPEGPHNKQAKFIKEWGLLEDELDTLLDEKGLMDPEVALLYGKKGRALEMVSRYDEALECYEKKLEIEQNIIKTDASDVRLQMVSTYHSTALVFSYQGKYKEAMEPLTNALAISIDFQGPDHPDTGPTYELMGKVLFSQRKWEEGIERYQNALNAYGPTHQRTGEIYKIIGVGLERQKKFGEALEQFEMALDIHLQVNGPAHPHTGQMYENMGVRLERLGKHEEALKQFEMALDFNLQVNGTEHRETKAAYDNMGRVFANKAKYDDEARKQVETVIATNLKAFEPTLGQCYRKHLVQFMQGEERELYEKRLSIEEVLNLSLKNQGVAIAITQFDGETALVEAYYHRHNEAVNFRLKGGVQMKMVGNIHGETQGLKACFRGRIPNIAIVLLESGVDSTAVNNDGHTALMDATKNGLTEIVGVFLDKGVDLHVADDLGFTALMIASQHGNTAIAGLLLDKGADPGVIDIFERTALMHASENGHTVIARLLLSKGADPTKADISDTTALMYASEHGHTVIAGLLLDKGADPTVTDNRGWTALMIAAERRHFGTVKLLLDNGSNPNKTDNSGTSALMIASKNGDLEMVKLMLEKGAKINMENGYEQSALSLASREGHTEIVKVLSNHSPNHDTVTSSSIEMKLFVIASLGVLTAVFMAALFAMMQTRSP